jgi:hypothetical protein
MNRIINIEQYRYHSGQINFAGTLRNAKKFELFQDVFILHDDKMVQCRIVGIELPPSDNPDYTYKIELPKEFIKDQTLRVSKTCSTIFSSLEEAKESAMRELDSKYRLNKENIERFFNQYNDGQKG